MRIVDHSISLPSSAWERRHGSSASRPRSRASHQRVPKQSLGTRTYAIAAPLVFGFFAATLCAQEADWKIGLARVKITPPQPVFMAGYASRNKPYESVHDDLFAKALVLEDKAGTRAVLITSDLIGFAAEIAKPLRERIAEKTGVPAKSVL